MGDFRKNFGRVKKIQDIPNLIEIQTRSYEKFLQKPIAAGKAGAISVCKALSRAFFPFRISAENVLWSLSVIRLVMSGMM